MSRWSILSRVALAAVIGGGSAILPGNASRAEATGLATLGTAAIRSGCQGPSNSIAIANDLMRNRYTFSPHPTVTLPSNPSWAENPLHDANWQFQYHTLRFVWALTRAWAETADHRYLERASFLLSDWYLDNPRSAPRSAYSWNDHSTAWRAMVYACAAAFLPRHAWLQDALLLHGRTLASSTFYVRRGNHALNQNIGLLEVGCLLGRADWKSLAADRTNTLIALSIDSQGVTNEQAVFYQLYNYSRYTYARRRLAECGQAVGSAFARLARMPAFLAQATLPNGTYTMLGDTQGTKASPIAGTPAEFAATLGASGPKPASTYGTYPMGFGFVRTGWGETRAMTDETMLSVRFGRARQYHGHYDGSSITLYGHGSPLLLDSGQYSYNTGPYRTYFMSRAAHNLVTADNATLDAGAGTTELWNRVSPTMYELALSGTPYVGVTASRRVTFSRSGGYAVVDDRVTSAIGRTFRQLWHLREASAPVLSGSRAWTRRTRGNVLIVQVLAPTYTRIVSGATSPIQGWLSYTYGRKVAAPVVEARRYGTAVRFLTVLIPYASVRPAVSISGLRLSASGYSMIVTVGGRRESIVAAGTGSSITPLE